MKNNKITSLLLCSVILVSTSNAMKNLNSIDENLSNSDNNITININNNQQDDNINLVNNTINTNDNKIDSITLQFSKLEENTNRIVKDEQSLLKAITDSIKYNTTKCNDPNKIITNDYIKFLKYNVINIYKSFKQIEFTDKNSKNNITQKFRDYIKCVQQVIRNNNDNGSKDYVLDIIYQYIVNREYNDKIIKKNSIQTSNTVNLQSNDAIKLQFEQLQYYYLLNIIALTSYYNKINNKNKNEYNIYGNLVITKIINFFSGYNKFSNHSERFNNEHNEYYNNWFIKQVLNDDIILKKFKYTQNNKKNNNDLSQVFSKIKEQYEILRNSYNELTEIYNGKKEIDKISNKECGIYSNNIISDTNIKEMCYVNKQLYNIVKALDLNDKNHNLNDSQKIILNNNNLMIKLNNHKDYFINVIDNLHNFIEPQIQNIKFDQKQIDVIRSKKDSIDKLLNKLSDHEEKCKKFENDFNTEDGKIQSLYNKYKNSSCEKLKSIFMRLDNYNVKHFTEEEYNSLKHFLVGYENSNNNIITEEEYNNLKQSLIEYGNSNNNIIMFKQLLENNEKQMEEINNILKQALENNEKLIKEINNMVVLTNKLMLIDFTNNEKQYLKYNNYNDAIRIYTLRQKYQNNEQQYKESILKYNIKLNKIKESIISIQELKILVKLLKDFIDMMYKSK